jgi:hypothetical protein
VGDGEQKTGFDFTLLPLSEQEIAPAPPRSRSTDSAPTDARRLSSPELFARRLPFRITFPLPPKRGLDPR